MVGVTRLELATSCTPSKHSSHLSYTPIIYFWEPRFLPGLFWQGRQDSNPQPTVLETVALPLSHSPV